MVGQPAPHDTGGVLPESFATDDGVVRWARLGEGGDPIVLVHGTPYSSFLWVHRPDTTR